MLQAELRVTSGKQVGNTIALPEGKFLVGREEDCHLRPNSDLISRHHCVFTLDEFGLRLRDLGSTNGCFVNGEKIRGAVVLKSGDSVSFGKLEFQVILGDPITDETRANLDDDLPTEIQPSINTGDETEIPQKEATPEEDDTIPAEASSTDTLMDIPSPFQQGTATDQSAAEGQSNAPAQNPQEQMPPMGDTQYYPPPGMPQQPGMPQMPVGYPPNMGYPQGMMPPYGYPGYPQQGYPGYPQQGYPSNMYPPQQMPPQEEQEPEKPQADEMDVRLPDPSQTGVKPPEPAAPEPESSGEEKKDERTADQKAKEEAPSAAADAIQQYLQRRPKRGDS